MRRFIFILMIALLPLRGWMGEAMATEMAAINIIAAQANYTLANGNLSTENSVLDCDMHRSSPQDDSGAKPSCTACQACNATGSLTSTVPINSILKVQYTRPLSQASQFVSASLALDQKPPIL
jgi:hypothetical protein